MPKIMQLSSHIANLIAAGEVVERPASVMKELLENAVDAGATQITAELRDGGMTFLRVTDNGCGMAAADARTAFLRHATSKLRTAEDLAAIETMGFRGEALAAIASVSRIELLTKTPGAISGVSLRLEAGQIVEEAEAGCPEGTTIVVRDLFYNTPARMKFMKSDTVEGSRATAAVQMQALAHPEVAFRLIRDGKQVLSTPGGGDLKSAVYCVYGRDAAKMIPVDSRWEQYQVRGFVSLPTDTRPSRSLQTFFVNNRPVKSKLLISALEEAYRNQIMTGRFPSCVLHVTLPANAVDVNVHPAKTEVKFLSEKSAFDCVHYGVLSALNQSPDRPEVRFTAKQEPERSAPAKPATGKPARKPENAFFQTMTPEQFKGFAGAVRQAPLPSAPAAAKTTAAMQAESALRQPVRLPEPEPVMPVLPEEPAPLPAPVQTALEMPAAIPWRLVGELYRTYILVEQGEEAFLIDKHAAHERILFERLKARQESIDSQLLLSPLPCRLSPEAVGILLSSREMLEELGFEMEEFGQNQVLVRRIPMDLTEADVSDALDSLAADLLRGRRESRDTVRDELLHTVACKAAIKAGAVTSEQELMTLAGQVMERSDLKHCPHGRPICVTLSKKNLERQFKRA